MSLSDTTIKAAKPGAKRSRLIDERGLLLLVPAVSASSAC